MQLSYAPVCRLLQVDLKPGSRESAVMHDHCFSDVSHLYSFAAIPNETAAEAWNLSRGPSAPGGHRLGWTAEGVPHHSAGAGSSRRASATR